VDDVPVLGPESDHRELQDLLASYGAPAYIRRARRVEEALNHLVLRCRRQRDVWLKVTRTRLALLKAHAGDWAILRPHVEDETDLVVLRRLYDELSPGLRVPVTPTTSTRVLRCALTDVVECLERFNRRWQKYLAEHDLAPINELREGYNRYYVFEKECAVRSAAVARQGFRRLEPLTFADLSAELPLLLVPRIKN
jgi:hypothetical protein